MVTAEKIERTALRNLIHNEDYTRKVLPFLKPEYFQDRSERVVFTEIQKFISQYNKRPTKETLQIDLGKRKDVFEFHVESLGIYAPEEIVMRALDTLKQKAYKWMEILENQQG